MQLIDERHKLLNEAGLKARMDALAAVIKPNEDKSRQELRQIAEGLLST